MENPNYIINILQHINIVSYKNDNAVKTSTYILDTLNPINTVFIIIPTT